MGVISSLFGSKPKDYVTRPGEYGELYRQERQGNNPIVDTFWGGTDVQWDGDQATITQTMNPQLEAIANQLMGHVSNGPAQLGQYSNPFLAGLMGNVSDSLNRRYGMQAPSMNMGGYSQPMTHGNNGLPTVQAPQQIQQAQSLPQQMPQQSTGGMMDMINQYQLMKNQVGG